MASKTVNLARATVNPTINDTLNQLVKLRNYYKLKKLLNIGGFWRRRVRLKLKSLVKRSDVNSIILGEDNILYPTQSRDLVTNSALYRGDALNELRWVLQRYIQPGSLCIDVGANLGYVSAYMAQCVGQTGKVWCFEPNTDICQRIECLFWLNQWQHYQIHQVALSDQDGQVSFTVDPTDHSTSHINQDGDSQQVPCKRLDSYLSDIGESNLSIIKIDVEGFEAAVLAGAQEVLRRYHPVLILESGLHQADDANAIDQHLSAAGYRLAGIIQDWGLQPIDGLVQLNQSEPRRHVNLLALPIRS